jgi:hypothetical protein
MATVSGSLSSIFRVVEVIPAITVDLGTATANTVTRLISNTETWASTDCKYIASSKFIVPATPFVIDIDLRAIEGSVGNIDGNGYKVLGIYFESKAGNTSPVAITSDVTDGYVGLGDPFNLELEATSTKDAWASFYPSLSKAAVGATNKILRITGETEADELDVMVLFSS